MHPAPSVIVFTTLSGAGFGMLFWLGLGLPAPTGWIGFGFFALAYLLAVGGLISSTFHLGHPERALLAFTQWRTSWLSREGVLAVAALLVMALYGAGLVFFEAWWWPLGLLGAALSLGTVYATAMIYAQMRTVPRWQGWSTPALYLALALGGGALLAGQRWPAVIFLAAAGAVQLWRWMDGDHAFARAGTTLSSATGLKHGTVRSFERPHTGPNYLLTEMVYEVGRKRAQQLRLVALVLGYALPLLLLLLPLGHLVALLAAVSHLLGVAASRWLFFAEAEHVLGLYYGRHGQQVT